MSVCSDQWIFLSLLKIESWECKKFDDYWGVNEEASINIFRGSLDMNGDQFKLHP